MLCGEGNEWRVCLEGMEAVTSSGVLYCLWWWILNCSLCGVITPAAVAMLSIRVRPVNAFIPHMNLRVPHVARVRYISVRAPSRHFSTSRSRIDQHLSILQDQLQDKHSNLLSKSGSTALDALWIPRLRRLRRPEARNLVTELTADNSLGFVLANGQPPGKNSLTYYVMQQKQLHPEKVLLVRVGEFYEAYGVDALMLVEYCGLNPMGMLSWKCELIICDLYLFSYE